MFAKKQSESRKSAPKQRRLSRTELDPAEKPVERGAERVEVPFFSLSYLKSLHRQMLVEAYRRILDTPVASFLNVLTIAVAFALPAVLVLLILNLQSLEGGWQGDPKAVLYLDSRMTSTELDALIGLVERDTAIREYTHIGPEEGLEQLQTQSKIQGVVDALGFNPLPGVLFLTPALETGPEQMELLVEKYDSRPGVEEVQVDLQWVERFHSLVGLIERIVLVLSLLLGAVVVMAIANTIRLSIENRQSEIRVIKLVGGTDGFVALPFIYMGGWYGFAGAFLALSVLWGVQFWLLPDVAELTLLYGSQFAPHGLTLSLALMLLLVGILLGVMGAVLTSYRSIRMAEQVG